MRTFSFLCVPLFKGFLVLGIFVEPECSRQKSGTQYFLIHAGDLAGIDLDRLLGWYHLLSPTYQPNGDNELKINTINSVEGL